MKEIGKLYELIEEYKNSKDKAEREEDKNTSRNK